jgi:hypothetical protein
MMTMHVMAIIVQDKARSYTKRTLGDDFIPLVVKTYSCFHLHFDSFLTSCVHVYITCHQQTSLIPLMFISHYKQRVSMTLQRTQAIAIFQQAVTLNHSSSSLSHIPTSAPPSLVDLWHRMPI